MIEKKFNLFNKISFKNNLSLFKVHEENILFKDRVCKFSIWLFIHHNLLDLTPFEIDHIFFEKDLSVCNLL